MYKSKGEARILEIWSPQEPALVFRSKLAMEMYEQGFQSHAINLYGYFSMVK